MKKQKNYRLAKRKMLMLTILLLIIIVAVFASVFKDWVQIFDNRHQVVELTNKYSNLLDEETQLKSDVNKLQDPDYVARYAREKYLYTKDGELIIRIPKSSESE
jgi:cell division protein DivIC